MKDIGAEFRALHQPDLAVEAEAFGARPRVADHDRPGHRSEDHIDHPDVGERGAVVVVEGEQAHEDDDLADAIERRVVE